MPEPAILAGVDAIVAAAHQLKLLRLASASAQKPPSAKTVKSGAKRVRCKLRIPKGEYRELARLRKQLARQGDDVRKNEVVRAGLLLLVGLDRNELKVAIREVIAPEPIVPARA